MKFIAPEQVGRREPDCRGVATKLSKPQTTEDPFIQNQNHPEHLDSIHFIVG